MNSCYYYIYPTLYHFLLLYKAYITSKEKTKIS